MTSRRGFLQTASAFAAGALAPSSALASVEAKPASNLAGDWRSVREAFSLSPDYLHLSQFFIVSHPRSVREAIERYRREIDANPLQTLEHHLFGPDEANLPAAVQRAAAAYMGAKAEEIALVDSTTMGLALIYNGLELKPGDEILTTAHDHYVHHESIRLCAARQKATARRVTLYDDAATCSEAQMVERLRAAIRPETRMFGLTWVHSSSGVKLPVKALAAVVAEVNRGRAEAECIRIVLDGVHGFGNQDVDIPSLGVDYFAAGTHKWIFAPRGTGIVWARPDRWAAIRPTIPSFQSFPTYQAWMDDSEPVPADANAHSPGGFKAYEHLWAMAEAFAFHRQIGRARVAERIAALNTRCKQGLAGMDHVTVHTPMDAALSAGIVCFDVRGLQPQEVVERLLEKRVVASSSPYKISRARLAPSLVNDEAQIDRALEAVASLV